MAEIVHHKPQGLFAKLGFKPKKEKDPGSRKLMKKKDNRYAAAPPVEPVEPLYRSSSFDFWAPPGTTFAESHSQPNFIEDSTPRNDSVATVRHAPRKLLKHPPPDREQRMDDVLDKDTGERKDLTEMMHAFGYDEEIEDISEKIEDDTVEYDYSRPDGATLLARASPELWLLISDHLSPIDIANLASTCRTMNIRLGDLPYFVLRNPSNRSYRLDFLLPLDSKLPNHLFCFPCASWHYRTQLGAETLKPPTVLNPLFICPNQTNVLLPPPRLRISEGRQLPFTFVQLARRHWAYGPSYGIPVQSLARRWKDPSSPWSHKTMYHVASNGHVLMRVQSQAFVAGGMTPAGKRMLLFSRSDYTPYFSVCAHWQKGLLSSLCKCALDHIPVQETNAVTRFRTQKAVGPVSLCGKCQPMRRCPSCPTEYLLELKLVEDKTVKVVGPARFKQALMMTRWSDLGPARSPEDAEWSAIVGERTGYDSFAEIGKRAVCGVFEAAFSDTTPGQRILSLDPGAKKGRRVEDPSREDENDDDGSWY
ncbi:unnamed protein product [Periconia digitata]|uniref:F-box domain-containing protein n=1 Tax=Periconia digitata TaxID=1303443 RepID=A0A9W4UML2_9PLEO|nr:unnamed protein product [Periconia digitata]